MLRVEKLQKLPSGHGVAGINFDGTIVIEQGRPHGVMANPGECFLSVEDLDFLKKMLKDFETSGGKILPPDAIRPA